jgi:hypothetical protein
MDSIIMLKYIENDGLYYNVFVKVGVMWYWKGVLGIIEEIKGKQGCS